MQWYYILALIVGGIALILLILLLIEAILIYRLKKDLGFTHYYVDNEVGFITYICGVVGAGKTTLGCGITNFLNETLIDKAINLIKGFTTIYYDFDFNKAYQIIKDSYNGKIYDANKITKIILKEDEYKVLGNMFYSNYLNDKVPAFNQLEGFVDACLSLIRFNYVYYYNSGFYSHITKKYAYNFTPDMIEIKDRAISKDYQIFTYSIIFEDEKQLSNKINTNFQQVAKEDAGSDMFLRLIRQLGKGTIYYITTSQEFTRAVKVERALATSILYITKRKIVNPYFISNFACRASIGLFSLIFKYKNKMLKRDEDMGYLYSSKFIKHFIFICKQKLKKNKSKSFIKYKVIKYNNADDVGKRVDLTTYGAKESILTFPLKYCFGSIDTYAFSAVQDYLIKDSKKLNNLTNVAKNDDKFVKSVLEKKITPIQKEKKVKTPSKKSKITGENLKEEK